MEYPEDRSYIFRLYWVYLRYSEVTDSDTDTGLELHGLENISLILLSSDVFF
jgi:hypothetical protein